MKKTMQTKKNRGDNYCIYYSVSSPIKKKQDQLFLNKRTFVTKEIYSPLRNQHMVTNKVWGLSELRFLYL